LRAYDNRSTSNIYVYLACGAIGFSYLIMAWNEYLARFKPDKLNIKMKSLLTKPLVEEGSIPFGFSSILFRQWLKESWWLADNIKKANLLIDLVLVMRNTSVRIQVLVGVFFLLLLTFPFTVIQFIAGGVPKSVYG